MVFDQNRQIVTKRNFSYGAKQFGLFWVKTALFTQKLYHEVGSV